MHTISEGIANILVYIHTLQSFYTKQGITYNTRQLLVSYILILNCIVCFIIFALNVFLF